MATTIIDSDVIIRGTVSASTVALGAGDVTDTNVSATADIGAAKVRHQFPVMYNTATGADVATESRVCHIAKGDGVIAAVEVVCETAPTGGDKQFTVDVHKGAAGSAYATILSSVVTMDNSDVDRTLNTATLSTTTYTDGDQFKIIITASGSTGTQGQDVCVVVWLQEKSS